MPTHPLTLDPPAPTQAYPGTLVFLPDRKWVVRVGCRSNGTWTCWLVAATDVDLFTTGRQSLADTELDAGRTQFTSDDLANPELLLLLWTVRLTQTSIGNCERLGRVMAWQIRQPGQLTVPLDQRACAVLTTRARVLPTAQPTALHRLIDAQLLVAEAPPGRDSVATYRFTLPDDTTTLVG